MYLDAGLEASTVMERDALEQDIQSIIPPAVLREVPVREVVGRHRLDGRGAATQQVYRLLHKLIVNLHLMPNQLLTENELAASLNLSKTPVREALIRLAEERLVVMAHQKATIVAPIDIRRVFEGYFIRLSLETTCAEQLAATATREDIAALEAIVTEMRRALDAGECERFYPLDNAFHGMTFERAGLPHTRRRVDVAKAEVDRVKSLKSVYRFCRSDEELFAEHRAIFLAIADGDGERACKEIHYHLTGMNEAIQAIAKEECLWRFINQVNQVAINTRLASGGDGRTAPSGLTALPNHP